MASCMKCGRRDLPKRRDGRFNCRTCGPLPNIIDRRVARQLGVAAYGGIEHAARAAGLSFSVDPDVALVAEPVVSTFKLRARAVLGRKGST